MQLPGPALWLKHVPYTVGAQDALSPSRGARGQSLQVPVASSGALQKADAVLSSKKSEMDRKHLGGGVGEVGPASSIMTLEKVDLKSSSCPGFGGQGPLGST